MPLTQKGKTLLQDFVERYGAKRGKRIFYSKENADPKFRKVVAKKHS